MKFRQRLWAAMTACASLAALAGPASAGDLAPRSLVSTDVTAAPTAAYDPAQQGAPLVSGNGLGGAPAAAETGTWASIAAYGWVFGVKGTIGARGQLAEVDFSVRNAIDALSDIRGAATLHAEAGVGDVGVILDLNYLLVRPVDGLAQVEVSGTFAELLGMYKILNPGSAPCPGDVSVDAIAGVRYYNFKDSIKIPLLGIDSQQTRDWVDLVVGARVSLQVVDKMRVFARGDIGGFGIGDSSKLAWNIITGVDCQFCSCASFVAGYRWFNIDQAQGTGRNAFILDATLSGPFVALAVKF